MMFCQSAMERPYFFSIEGKYDGGPCFGHGADISTTIEPPFVLVLANITMEFPRSRRELLRTTYHAIEKFEARRPSQASRSTVKEHRNSPLGPKVFDRVVRLGRSLVGTSRRSVDPARSASFTVPGVAPGAKAGVTVWLSSPRVHSFSDYDDALRGNQVPEPFPGAYDSSFLSMTSDEAKEGLNAGG